MQKIAMQKITKKTQKKIKLMNFKCTRTKKNRQKNGGNRKKSKIATNQAALYAKNTKF